MILEERIGHILARLGPAAVRIAPQAMPTSRGPGLLPAEIAAAMAGLPEGVECLLRGKYAGDERALRRAEIRLYLRAIDMAVEERWRVPRGRKLIRRMSRLALHETVSPGICRRCAGTGGGSDVCQACRGSGRQPLTGGARARILGLDRAAWRRTWAGRYERIFGVAQAWERAGLAHVARRLGR